MWMRIKCKQINLVQNQSNLWIQRKLKYIFKNYVIYTNYLGINNVIVIIGNIINLMITVQLLYFDHKYFTVSH